MKQILFLVLLAFPLLVFADTTNTKTLVTQTIVYKTNKASEVYLVWAMDDWKIPSKQFLLPGNYINNGMAYTRMNGYKDSFSIKLQLPKGTYIDFMIWASKDLKGDSIQGWDNNWGSSYNIFIDGKNETNTLKDEKLYIAEKTAPQEKTFDLFENGPVVLLASFFILFFGVLIKFLNKPKKINWFQGDHFILGLLLSTSILMLLTRLQLNGYLSKETYLLFGATYYDFQIVLLVGIFSFLLLFITRRNKYIHFIALLCMATLIFILAISSVLNIEIVRQIGKPITYNWLYYSDFLKSNDAKNAIKASFTPTLTSSLLYIVIGLFLASIGFSITNQSISKNNKKKFIITSAAFALIIGTGFLQVQAKEFEQPKVENPVTAFVLSWINSGDRFKIFTVEVPGDIRLKVEQMHQPKANEKIPFSDSIRNIVIFVFESTPANLVEVFDSTYRVTPNLNKWKQHAIIYENMYAHLPTTPNTMLSIISGIYPMTNYKSAVNEYPEIKIPSLPGTLKTNGWTTSLFFSSDLSYSNMDLYLKNQQIETAQDFKTISCNYRGFNSNYAKLDGLDDRCIVNRYFNWKGNVHPLKKTFSILWSNQTHYPYFFSGDEKEYTDNTGLNKYLNALEEVDVAFGELMDGLQKRRELETTLVLVVGDHGEAFGTHNQYTHAGNIYEENMKVPCLLINPLLFKGEKDNRISGMIDVAPTITNIAGIQQPYEWQGESMLGFSKRNHVFFIGPYSDFQFGSRFGNWKLIYSAANDQFKLFDVQKDPGELKDLSKNNKKIIEDEYKLMAGWVQYHNLKTADFLKK